MVELNTKLIEKLKKQQYETTGIHSAIKICSWTKKSLRDEGICYKEKFYGIRCHLCAQISPSVGFCQNNCAFCWRELDNTTGTDLMQGELDEPKEIIKNSILMQQKLLSGFGGNAKVNPKKLKQAQKPMHFAISLTGEPTLYPKLNNLIKELHNQNKTTFVVSNGQNPLAIKNIEPPTQLYLSVDAPTKDLFNIIDRPVNKDGWERLLESLSYIKELKEKTRTTLRFTLIKEMNMTNPEKWAELIKLSNPLFIEVKAYMFVGSSILRLKIENMPKHDEVREFSKQICKYCDYNIIDEKEESRVILLAKSDFPERIMKFD
jgi:tRNA wybutosine-synthesizing protein 1